LPFFAAVMRPRIDSALTQASSSVGAMIGRKATCRIGRSVRPADAAAASIEAIWSRVPASGSPQSA
jgi:hypothetical protein